MPLDLDLLRGLAAQDHTNLALRDLDDHFEALRADHGVWAMTCHWRIGSGPRCRRRAVVMLGPTGEHHKLRGCCREHKAVMVEAIAREIWEAAATAHPEIERLLVTVQEHWLLSPDMACAVLWGT